LTSTSLAIVAGGTESFDDIAAAEGLAERHVRRLAPLAFLSPRIIEAIADGAAPAGLTVSRLTQALPHAWSRKRDGGGIFALFFWSSRAILDFARGDIDHALGPLVEIARAFRGFGRCLLGHIAARFDTALFARPPQTSCLSGRSTYASEPKTILPKFHLF
jgi:hypothetical protein